MKTHSTERMKLAVLVFLVLVITALHYGTSLSEHHYHVFLRDLYYLPIILGGFWFGLWGGVGTALSISVLYVPFIWMTWQHFSPDDFDKAMEIVLYFVVGGTLGFLRDREKAEHEARIKSESLAAMGRAVSTVAHDMKTPLIAIGGFSRMVQKKMDEGDPCYEKLAIVIQETGRLENMVKQMLSFSKPLDLDLTVDNLNSVIQKSLTVLENCTTDKRVAIETDLHSSLPAVPLDPARMEQVVLNLVFNAIQASPEGEVVTVRTFAEASHIRMDVVDSGCGIPGDKKERIFTAFFTTKKEGTGLGLAIVKKIVEAHNGRLAFRDNRERGTTFTVYLPLGTPRNTS